jgi:hypothetical protein
MKKFLAVYLGSEASMKKWEGLSEAARKEKEQAGMNGWMNWVNENKKSIVELGSPLGKTKLINPKGISDTKNALTAFTVVEAESHEAAAKLFLNHPHFSIFPGDSVEIMECLPIPGM